MDATIVKDNGYKSRKLWFCIGAVASMLGAWVYAGTHEVLIPMFPTLVGGVTTLTGLFLTGRLVNTWVATKAEPANPE